MKDAGYDIMISAYYGLEPGGLLTTHGIPVLPSKLGSFGEHSLKYWIQLYKRNVALLHTDPWAFPWFPTLDAYTVSYGPFDSYNYPEEIVNIMRQYQLLIAPSKFQVREWRKYGVEYRYIPHGVDTSVYHPIEQSVAREKTKMPQDKFIIGIVGANSDKEIRKGYPRMFKAIRYFLDQNPDAWKDLRLYIHTNPVDSRGINIDLFLKKRGLREISALEDPNIHQLGFTEDEMCYLYNSFDILLHTSMREGFGLCIIESEACGTPVITHESTSQTELVKGHGWLAKSLTVDLNLIDTPINAETPIPDVYSIAECIEDAYNHPEKIEKYSRECRKFALQYDWNKVFVDYWIPILEELEEELSDLPIERRRIK